MQEGRQMRLTEPEIALIKATYKDNMPLLLLLRKIFLPEVDPFAPIGQIVDLWMTLNVTNMSPDQAYVNILARNQLITHVEQQIQQLAVLANQEELTDAQKVEKANKDSSQ